jgi:hypothetical protein
MSQMILIVRIFIVVLLGSYTKEFFDIMSIKKEEKKVHLMKILLSSVGATIIIFSLSDVIISEYSDKIFISINYISGLGSYKLIKTLTKVSIKNMIPYLEKLGSEEDDGTDDSD